MMVTTPSPIIDSVVQSVYGRAAVRIIPLTGGGMNETHLLDPRVDLPVIAVSRASLD